MTWRCLKQPPRERLIRLECIVFQSYTIMTTTMTVTIICSVLSGNKYFKTHKSMRRDICPFVSVGFRRTSSNCGWLGMCLIDHLYILYCVRNCISLWVSQIDKTGEGLACPVSIIRSSFRIPTILVNTCKCPYILFANVPSLWLLSPSLECSRVWMTRIHIFISFGNHRYAVRTTYNIDTTQASTLVHRNGICMCSCTERSPLYFRCRRRDAWCTHSAVIHQHMYAIENFYLFLYAMRKQFT